MPVGGGFLGCLPRIGLVGRSAMSTILKAGETALSLVPCSQTGRIPITSPGRKPCSSRNIAWIRPVANHEVVSLPAHRALFISRRLEDSRSTDRILIVNLLVSSFAVQPSPGATKAAPQDIAPNVRNDRRFIACSSRISAPSVASSRCSSSGVFAGAGPTHCRPE